MSHDVNPYRAAPPIDIDDAPSGPVPSTAQFMLEVDDIAAFCLRSPAARKQLRTTRLVVGVLLGVVVIGALTLSQVSEPAVLVPFAAALAVCTILGVSVSPPMVRRRARRSCEGIKWGRLPRPQTVAISEKGILRTTPYAEARYQWEGFESIDTTPTHAFFYLSQFEAVIVPARAFASEAQFHRFVALAREFWNRKRSASP